MCLYGRHWHSRKTDRPQSVRVRVAKSNRHRSYQSYITITHHIIHHNVNHPSQFHFSSPILHPRINHTSRIIKTLIVPHNFLFITQSATTKDASPLPTPQTYKPISTVPNHKKLQSSRQTTESTKARSYNRGIAKDKNRGGGCVFGIHDL